MGRLKDESVVDWFTRWKVSYTELRKLYCCDKNRFKRAQFDLQRSLQRELDLGVAAILSLAGKKIDQKSDNTVLFCLGDCSIGKPGKIGYYSTFSKYLLKKLKELKYDVLYVDEYYTSQKFPGVGHKTVLSGENRIRIKYCKELNIHINRDLMAGENMVDIGVCKVKSLDRPSYLKRAMINNNTASQAVAK